MAAVGRSVWGVEDFRTIFETIRRPLPRPRPRNTVQLVLYESLKTYSTQQDERIVSRLIERAKFPFNSPTYDETYPILGFNEPLGQLVMDTENLLAKSGRYESPVEHPFFPLPPPEPVAPTYKHPEVLHPAAAAININRYIWEGYFKSLLPSFTTKGDDGNYDKTALCDLEFLQAVSSRIHSGVYIAEAKFRESRHVYASAILARDRNALMKLLTLECEEEMVKRRVVKMAMELGQDGDTGKYKVDPSIVSCLFEKLVIPLTKLVGVEYLLRRLD